VQAELSILPEAAGHKIVRKAHLKYLDPGVLRAGWPVVKTIRLNPFDDTG
jgi:hypothetical protein